MNAIPGELRAAPRPLVCTLQDFQRRHAVQVGDDRTEYALANGLENVMPCEPYEQRGRNIEGAASEIAVAWYLGIYYLGSVGDLNAEDVGPVQVRSTPHANGCLILKARDAKNDGAPFVLVTGQMPTFKLRGWVVARDGKPLAKFRDRGVGEVPNWWIGQEALRPMPDLISRLVRGADGRSWRFEDH